VSLRGWGAAMHQHSREYFRRLNQPDLLANRPDRGRRQPLNLPGWPRVAGADVDGALLVCLSSLQSFFVGWPRYRRTMFLLMAGPGPGSFWDQSDFTGGTLGRTVTNAAPRHHWLGDLRAVLAANRKERSLGGSILPIYILGLFLALG